MQRTRLVHVAGLLTGIVLSAALLFGGTAGAHVTVQPPEVEQGGFAKLTFRVPNERDNAATVALRVQLPQDHPFTSVSVKPKQGWTAEVTERTLDTPLDNRGEAVTEVASEIAWTGGTIEPGQFDEFEVSVGRIPTDTDVIYFPAIQVYDDGEEVSWIEVPAESGEEPESPAPALTLTAASADGDAAAHDSSNASTNSESPAASTADEDGDSSNGLAIAALVVGGIAIVLSIVAIAASRRSTAT